MPEVILTIWSSTTNTPIAGANGYIGASYGTSDNNGICDIGDFENGDYAVTVYVPVGYEPRSLGFNIHLEGSPYTAKITFGEAAAIPVTPPTTGAPIVTYKGYDVFQNATTGLYYYFMNGVESAYFDSVALAEASIDGLAVTVIPTPVSTQPVAPTLMSATSNLGWLQGIADWLGSLAKWFGDNFVTPISNAFSGIETTLGNVNNQLNARNDVARQQLLQDAGSAGNLVKGLFDEFTSIESGLTKPLTDFGPNVAKEVSDAMSAHSPDPDIKAAVDEMVKMIISKQEEINKSISHSPIDPAQSQQAALTLAGELLGISVSVPLAGMLIDLLHPIKNIGAFDLAVNLMNNVGLEKVTSDIMSAPAEMGILPALHRYYNSIYQTELPNASELISLRSRNWLTEDAYETGLAYQGLSKDWAATLLNGSYADPGIGLLRILYDMGSVSAADLPAYVNHLGYRPEYQDLITNYITKYQENRFRLRYVVAVGMGYSRGVIDAPELTTLITGAGYSSGSADWIMKASDIRKEIIDRGSAKPRLVSVGELKLLYANDKITEDALRTELVLRKYTTDQVEILIEALNLSKSTEIEGHKKITLSISELLKAWKKGVITEDYLRIHLTLKGLTTEEQDILINTNKPTA